MEGGQNGKLSKWNEVKMKSGQNEKYAPLFKINNSQNVMWSKLRVVKIESGQNGKWSK